MNASAKRKDINDRALENSLPRDPADETVRILPKPFLRGDHVEIAERLIEILRVHAGGHVVADEGMIYAYDSKRGVWTETSASEQSRIVQSFAGCSIAKGDRAVPLKVQASDVAGAIKLAADQVGRPSFFADGRKGIAFTNGFAEVTAAGVRMHTHSPDHRTRFAYAFPYEKTVAKRFLTFLESIWRDDPDKHEKIALLQEFGGACLVGNATTYQRAIIGIGDGGNGKGVTTKIVVGAMPPGSVTAIPPQELGNEYRRAMLAGKLINVVNELPEADIIDSEAFKAVVAGDVIVGRQIRQAPFTFVPVAGHLFAANRLPGTNDLTQGFWRRLIVLTFNRSFTNDPECDPHLANKIIDTELPAIVAWLLDGAVRLINEREFTLPASHARALEDWKRSADQVAQFIEDCTRPLLASETHGDAAKDVYASYRTWALQNGHRPMASNKFGRRLEQLGSGSVHTKYGNRYPFTVKRGEGLVQDFSPPTSPVNHWGRS